MVICVRDDELMAELEACTLPEDQFHHGNHVRAAWVYLTRLPTLEAMEKFSKALRRYAASLGKPDRYHETITWAYLLLVNERIHRTELAANWESFAAQNTDLLDWGNSILRRYYRAETLQSAHARHVFVMPDNATTSRQG